MWRSRIWVLRFCGEVRIFESKSIKTPLQSDVNSTSLFLSFLKLNPISGATTVQVLSSIKYTEIAEAIKFLVCVLEAMKHKIYTPNWAHGNYAPKSQERNQNFGFAFDYLEEIQILKFKQYEFEGSW